MDFRNISLLYFIEFEECCFHIYNLSCVNMNFLTLSDQSVIPALIEKAWLCKPHGGRDRTIGVKLIISLIIRWLISIKFM